MAKPKNPWYILGDFRKGPSLRKKRELESYGIFEVYNDNQKCCSYCGNLYFTMYVDEPVSICAQCID